MELPNREIRARLAEQAAGRRLGGLDPLPVLSGLRLLTTAELLCRGAPPRRPADAGAVLDALCTAVQGSVRRRSG